LGCGAPTVEHRKVDLAGLGGPSRRRHTLVRGNRVEDADRVVADQKRQGRCRTLRSHRTALNSSTTGITSRILH
jgi:hypothetical protein